MLNHKELDLSRRDWLRLSASGVLAGCVSGWFDSLAWAAAAQGAKPKSCIMLWMNGGPSGTHTFDPKPEDSRSGCKAIPTSAPGVAVSEFMPHMAKQMHHVAILRTMHSTIEADHSLAHNYMSTGYQKVAGNITYPHLGSVVSRELGRPDAPIPNFVMMGHQHQSPAWGRSPGYLGPDHAPLKVSESKNGSLSLPDVLAAEKIANLPGKGELLAQVDRMFQDRYQAAAIEGHRTGCQRAIQLVQANKILKALQIEEEPLAVRQAYGDGIDSKRFLAARRLIENGCRFVEVATGEWDTHGDKGGQKQRKLIDGIDRPMAALLDDLHQRGMLENTLVIWMGEFGRSVHGANHNAWCWSTALAGAGLKTGQAIGRTQTEKSDTRSITQADGPQIRIPDFMATVMKALGIDYTKSTKIQGRRVGLAEREANPTPVKELFG